MVSKNTAAGTKKAPSQNAAKKSTLKTTAKKSVSSVSKSTKVIDKQVPVKANIDPMEKVMAIKAQNDAKKSPVVTGKGAKAAFSTKSKSVKENAQKVAAKKFAENKEEVSTTKSCHCCLTCKDGLFSSWVRAYKNIFNFKGRTSRYETWGFMLLNFFFVIAFLGALVGFIGALENGALAQSSLLLTEISLGILFIFILIEAIAYLSLIVRRLHDVGQPAWKGNFRPVIILSVLALLLGFGSFVIIQRLGDRLLSPDANIISGLSLYVVLFLFILLALGYYTFKLLLVVSFFEEDDDNAYGVANYTDKSFVIKAFKYAAIYYIAVSFLNWILQIFQTHAALL